MINNVFTQFPKTYTGDTSPGTVTVFTGAGVINGIVIEKALVSGLVLKDNGVTFASFAAAVAAGTYTFQADINKTLTYTTFATEAVTIMAGPV